MKKYLDFGILVDKDGDAYPSRADLEYYAPKDHRHLMHFMQVDFAEIIGMVSEGYKKKDPKKIEAARDLLKKTHPYLGLNDSISNAYINKEIIRQAWINQNNEFISDDDFKKVAIVTEYQSTDPNDYLISHDADGYGSLYSLMNYQTDLRLRIFLLLDKSHPKLRDVPFETRCGIYGVVSVRGDFNYEPETRLPACKVVLSCPEAFNGVRAAVDFDENLHEKLVTEAAGLAFNNQANIETILQIINRIKTPEKTDAYEEYRIENLENLLDLEVSLMISENVSIGRCERCGRYFVYEEEADELESAFCDIRNDKGSSCLTEARLKAFSANLQKIYTRAYRTRFERFRAGKITKDALNAWRAMAHKEKARVTHGELTLDEYKKVISD